MKFLDTLVAAIAPKFAIRRIQARESIKAYYEAVKFDRLHSRKLNSSDPDAVTQPAVAITRDLARDIEQNNDTGRGILNTLVNNTVGDGIKPIPLVKDVTGELAQDFNKALKAAYDEWVRNPEVTGDFDYYSAQRMIARSLFRDGEIFLQHLEGNVPRLDHASVVPYSIEMIESDYVPMDYNDENKGIIQGIQKNAWGKATRYFIYKENPDRKALTSRQDVKTIAAKKMTHLKLIDRIRQTRGVSVFASVFNRLDDVKEIDENERVAGRVAAAMAAFIRKGSPDMYVKTSTPYREMEFVPGMIFDDLMPGEEIGTIDTTRPNNELIPFRDAQLRAVAAGTATGYSTISRNYNGTYSAQRQELVEQYSNYGVIWAYLKDRMAVPIWERFVAMAVASGTVDVSGIDESTLYNASFTRPPMPWIDPSREMSAIEKEIGLGLTSRSDVIMRRGGDPDEVFRKIKEEAGVLGEVQQNQSEPQQNQSEPQQDEAQALDDIEVGAIVRTADGYYLRRTADGYEPV